MIARSDRGRDGRSTIQGILRGGRLGMRPNALAAPLAVCVELTYACNLRCVHCMSGNRGAVYVSGARAATAIAGREWDTAAILSLIDDLAEAGVFLLYVSGGEPLVHPDCIELCAYGTARGLYVCLFTDAMLIDPAVAARLVAAGVRKIQTNLDGATATVYDQFRGVAGAFAATTRGIRACVAAGLSVRVNITMTRRNIDELPRVVDLAGQLGVKEVIALPLRRAGRALRDLDRLELTAAEFAARIPAFRGLKAALPAGFRLAFERDDDIDGVVDPAGVLPSDGAGRYHCCVTPTGLVKPEPESPNSPEWIAGDLGQRPFLEIWRHSPLFGMLRDPDLPEYEACLLHQPDGACPARLSRADGLDAPPWEACSYCRLYYRGSEAAASWASPTSTWSTT